MEHFLTTENKKASGISPKAITSNEKTAAVGGGFEPPRGS